MRIKLRLSGFIVLLVACVTSHADGSSSARHCVAIADREARLACFDAAFAAPEKAAAPTVAAVPTSAAASAAVTPPAATFGGESLEKPAAAKGPRSMKAVITAVTPHPGYMFRLSLDNGQVWDTREASLTANFSPGDRVTIDRMMAGGYQLTASAGGRSIGVKRAQ